MADKHILKQEISDRIDRYFETEKEIFMPGKSKIPLMVPTYSADEVKEALDSLLSTYVTMGSKVKKFEEMFSKYIGMQHGIMVNSGSSADLLALHALSDRYQDDGIKQGDEIITVPLTWSTAVSSIVNFGAVPVFVDVDLHSYNINPNLIEEAISSKTKAIMPVHLLGNPCEMDTIMDIATAHNLFVIEDTCESYGAEYKDKKAGSFGDIATTSFFFSHHITTIEGGMLVTNDEHLSDIIRSLRAHGWIREMSNKDSILKQNPSIDSRFFFYTLGFNVRPTDIQGAFGIHQLPRLEGLIEKRRENARYLNENLKEYGEFILLPIENENTRHVYFCYPITVSKEAPFTKKEFVSYLESKNIETRPIETGNYLKHPVSKILPFSRQVGNLANVDYIHENSFFIGNHQGFEKEHLDYIVETFKLFIKSKK